jgi:hypothetical protein
MTALAEVLKNKIASEMQNDKIRVIMRAQVLTSTLPRKPQDARRRLPTAAAIPHRMGTRKGMGAPNARPRSGFLC